MELDERKQKILQAIIRNYMETGEPVGSRTISKYSDLNLSSATIRNEMSDLEEMGYIVQPHTSAGRIPSDKGYRLYVDRILEEKNHEVQELKDLMIERTDKMEQVLKQVVKVLAANTNYATMVSAPTYHRNKLKFIQLSKVNATQILTVIMIEGNIVRNKVIDVTEELDQETVLKLNILLNSVLNGLSIEEINLAMIQNLKEQVCDDISENARNDNADYCDRHNTTSLFTYTHADCRGNGLRKEGNIVDVFYAKQRTQEKNAACAGCHTRGNSHDHRKEILF